MTDREDAIKEQFYALHLRGKGQLDDAIELYRKRLAIEPGAARTRSQLAVTLSQKGNAAEALCEARLAVDSEPGCSGLRMILTSLLLKYKRWSEALAESNELLRMEPDQVSSYVLVAESYHGMGDLNAAIRSYEIALSLNLGQPDTFDSLGQLYEEAGRFDEAVGVYRRLLEFAPRFRMGRLHLGNALAASGRVVEARHEWRRLLTASDLEGKSSGPINPALDEAGVLASENLERHTET
jgi:tetratricopeptide (TPR) repeat protein